MPLHKLTLFLPGVRRGLGGGLILPPGHKILICLDCPENLNLRLSFDNKCPDIG